MVQLGQRSGVAGPPGPAAYLTVRRLRGYSEAGSARVPAASSGAYGMVQPRSWLRGLQSLTLVQMLLDEGDAAIG